MSLWHCTECSTAYAVGLPACPHCRSTSKEENPVPKNHVDGGPSYAGHVDTSSPDTVTPEWAPAPEADVVEPVVEAKPDPAPKRPRKGESVRAQAGHAAGTGSARSAG